MTFRASVLTLYPEMFPGPLGLSLAGDARMRGVWDLAAHDIRRHGIVGDDIGAVEFCEQGFGGFQVAARGRLGDGCKALVIGCGNDDRRQVGFHDETLGTLGVKPRRSGGAGGKKRKGKAGRAHPEERPGWNDTPGPGALAGSRGYSPAIG